MAPEITEIWVYLSESPLLWLTVTLVAYVGAERVSVKLSRHPLANPVVIAATLIVGLLVVTGTSYGTYFDGAQFVHFLLGPATIALAVPLYRNIGAVRKSMLPMAAALVAGSLTAPIAMELARNLGGIASLAAVLVILTGVTGAVIVTPLMNALGIRDFAARGFAAGVASHGIGTARAFQVSELAGTFAGIAMGLSGALTSLIILLWIAFHV